MKYIRLIVVACLFFFSFSCGDDYIENGIEGRWQMTKVIKADGTELTVDTIFYNFKKGVFQYQKLTSPNKSSYSMGIYKEYKDSLYLEMREHTVLVYSDWNGDSIRTYRIQQQNSTRMELEFNDDMYYFRKY